MITNVRPRRDLDPVTYEVVWNGTHRGCDADLLVPESRQPEKRVAVDPRAHSARERVRLTLATSRAGGLTYPQIMAKTGLDSQAVRSALYHFSLRGELGHEDVNPLVARTVRPPQRYWRTV